MTEGRGGRCRPWHAHLGAALVIVLMTVGLLVSERRVGVTVDEFGHLVRGLAIAWAPDTRLNWPHPPLPHLLVASPTLLREERVDLTKLPGWKEADFTKTVKGYWRKVGYDEARRHLVAGRRVMIALAAAVAAWLYVWTRRRMGTVVGLVALVLWTSHTTLLAHAQLVTNDFAAGCCALLLAATLTDVMRRPRRRTMLAFAAACAASVVTKVSLAAIVVLASGLLVLGAAAGVGGFRRRPFARRLGRAVGAVAVAGLVAWVTILAAYRFDRAFLTVTAFNAVTEPDTTYARKEKRPIAALDLPASVVVPLPYSYVFSFQFVRAQNADGHTGWFRGKPNPGGDPAYFPTLAVLKTPIGLMVLVVAGLVLTLVRRRRHLLVPVAFVLTIAYFAIASRSRINLGFRHASPAVAWTILLGARGAAELLRGRRWRRPGAVIVAGSTLACAGAAVAAWPLFLGDFNALAGGRAGGLSVNLAEEDWGQDTPDLARLVTSQGLEPLHLFSRFSTMKNELKHFGVRFDGVGCNERVDGWVAVGIKDWTERRSCFRWMGDATPVHVVNDHILVFRVEGSGASAPRRGRDDEAEEDP